MVVLTLCYILLSRLTGQEDIVIGAPTVQRPHPNLDQVLGLFLNPLALRNFPCRQKRFIDFLAEVRVRTLEAFSYTHYPFEELVDALLTEREPGRHPIFDVMLATYTFNPPAPVPAPGVLGNSQGLPGLWVGKQDYKTTTSKFDLAVICVESEETMSFSFQYSSRLFKPETMRRFTQYFRQITASVIENPLVCLKDIALDYQLADAEPIDHYEDFAF